MTFKSKRILAGMLAGVAFVAAYLIYALSAASPDAGDLQAWAIVMLVSLGIAVASMIVLHIVFHITASIGIAVRERDKSDKDVEKIVEASMAEDEMDKLISRKASAVGLAVSGIGFIAMLVSLAFGASALIALHIMLGALAFGGLVDGGMSIFYYERGVGSE